MSSVSPLKNWSALITDSWVKNRLPRSLPSVFLLMTSQSLKNHLKLRIGALKTNLTYQTGLFRLEQTKSASNCSLKTKKTCFTRTWATRSQTKSGYIPLTLLTTTKIVLKRAPNQKEVLTKKDRNKTTEACWRNNVLERKSLLKSQITKVWLIHSLTQPKMQTT